MENNTKLMVNCDVCDARKAKIEELSRYESIVINTNVMLIDERSKAVLNSLPINCNAVEFLEMEGEVETIAINGHYELNDSIRVTQNSLLIVNGHLTIQPSAAEVIGNFKKIFVNGSLQYPQSMTSLLQKVRLNGCSECIPDGCEVLRNPNFTVSKYFPDMAEKGRTYYARDSIILWDASVVIDTLLQKNVRFVAPQFICTEKLLSQAAVMFDENTEFMEIPADCAFLNGDVLLSVDLAEHNNGRMFINGNLTLNQESTPALRKMQKLVVNGEVSLPQNQLYEFKKLNAQYQILNVIKGQRIKNQLEVKIDRTLLNAGRGSFSIVNCVCVTIDEDISPEEILGRLEFLNCACIKCSPNQRSAVETVGKNTAHIDTGEGEHKKNPDLTNARIINSGKYIL